MLRPNTSDINLASMTGGDDSSCVSILVDQSILLKGTPSLSFNWPLHIAMVTGNNEVLFSPDVPQEMCAATPSVMMTHPASSDGHVCDPFCDVPNTCRYAKEGGTESNIYSLHHFYCDCVNDLCDELLLMLRPESVRGMLSIWKTYLVYPWYLWHRFY